MKDYIASEIAKHVEKLPEYHARYDNTPEKYDNNPVAMASLREDIKYVNGRLDALRDMQFELLKGGN